MTIYIVERNNPESWEEPEVYVNGKKALDTVREEYESKRKNSASKMKMTVMVQGGANGTLVNVIIAAMR